jgi:hypothetical protein
MADIIDFSFLIENKRQEFKAAVKKCEKLLPLLYNLKTKKVVIFDSNFKAEKSFPVEDAIFIIENSDLVFTQLVIFLQECLEEADNSKKEARAWENFDAMIEMYIFDLEIMLENQMINPRPIPNSAEDPVVINFLTA